MKKPTPAKPASMHHPGKGPVKCDECPKEFRNSWGLRIHKARIHESENWTSGPREGAGRKNGRATKGAAGQHGFAAKFCPNCGCPLQGIAPGIEAAARLNGGVS
jgi:hypothetical protein